MGIGDALTELGSFLDDCEARGGGIERVQLAEVTGAAEGLLRADVELRLSVDERATPSLCDPQVGADGTVRFALASTTELLPVEDHAVRVEPAAGTVEDEGAVVEFRVIVPDATDPVSVTGESADSPNSDILDGERPSESGPDGPVGSEEGDATVTAVSGGSRQDREVPPFKDPDLLAAIYDSCDTFAEMAEELEMDVTAETVRRYMIDYDIHEPDTYRTGGATAASADDQVVLSDGIGLPDDVTAEDLVETVERSNTIYEVKQDIDIERDDALEMLQDLNLLDLVVGRLATEGEREVTREDIVDRLREASAVQ
ncbi:MAG: hypothetical protein V5A44_09135 [Haloarculaceae archaeon]